jgi:hypothetical protein
MPRKKPVEVHRGICSLRRGYCSPRLDAIPAAPEFTWGFWIRPTSRTHVDANILQKGHSVYEHGPTIDLEGRSHALVVRLDLQHGMVEARTFGGLPLEAWTLVVISVGRQRLRIYLDGRLDVERRFVGEIRRNDGPVWLSSPWYPSAEVRLADVVFIAAEHSPADLSVAKPPAGS